MYKLVKDYLSGSIHIVQRLSDNTFIPFAPDNTDYQQFKKELANGAELQDADGTPMTADAIATFLQGLQ
jgi:hypothetical protein